MKLKVINLIILSTIICPQALTITLQEYAANNSLEIIYNAEKIEHVLDLSGKELTCIKGISECLCQLSGENKKITRFNNLRIDLSNNSLTKLPQSLVRLLNLKNLDLSENNFDEIPEIIASLPYTTFINLRNNPFVANFENQLPPEKIGRFERRDQLEDGSYIYYRSYNPLHPICKIDFGLPKIEKKGSRIRPASRGLD